MSTIKSKYLVIGSGIAGLSFALKVADSGKVNLITKTKLNECNTSKAQGGIAAVTSDYDNPEQHKKDTMIAGAGLCHNDSLDVLVNEGPDRIKELIEWGVNFTKAENGEYDLAKEGGHSANRILHATDATGKEIEDSLIEKVKKHPNIEIFEYRFAIDLITEHQVRNNLQSAFNICFGAYILNLNNNSIDIFRANYTMLATGGSAKVYLHTTNPEVDTGDGIAMAYRAGARIANMEFIQFHPTALYNPKEEPFLISEALRGFGGKLKNQSGEEFMKKYDERLELAPRDIVARAIDSEMKKHGSDFVYLDMTNLDSVKVKEHFPTIYSHCREKLKIDITKDLIPVVPASHYICGGVMTNMKGNTSMHNLYASGETAHTGIHGANRLASNSLTEALVFSHRSAMKILNKKYDEEFSNIEIPQWEDDGKLNHDEWILIKHNKQELQNIMWDYVGIVRSKPHLTRALRRTKLLYDEIEDYYKRTKINKEVLELRNLTTIGYLIITSALRREESRGLHFMSDYPNKDKKFYKDTII
ncbi:MAG: L-aspartate oxidase [Candidatus Marinimicrobia bacterium]|nr:L-aspartate oxidase [Candidatus Neomarinimicrobiota bacterium]